MTDQPDTPTPFPHLRELDALLDDLVMVWDLTDPYELGVVRCLQDMITAKTTDVPWHDTAIVDIADLRSTVLMIGHDDAALTPGELAARNRMRGAAHVHNPEGPDVDPATGDEAETMP